MGKGVHRSLNVYLSKLRMSLTRDHNQGSLSPKATSTTTSRLLSACKYPKTPSFGAGRHHPDSSNDRSGREGGHAATLADVDRFLLENFNSLYSTRDDDDPDGEAAAAPLDRYLAGDDCSSPWPRDAEPPPDVRASRRFFVSPGTSNSLLEEARPSAASTTSSSYSAESSSSSTATVTQPPPPRPSDAGGALPPVPGDGVPVMTFSKDPYQDFRRSMQEMVASRHVDPRESLDWDFMEDLLISYLELNDRSVHRHIIGAFTDLVVTARRRRPSPGGRRWVLATSCRRRWPEREGTGEEEA